MKKYIVVFLLLMFTCGAIIAQENKNKKVKVENITSSNYAEKIKSGLVLVDFWARWCAPCRKINPVLKDLAKEGEISVLKFDVDSDKNFAKNKGVTIIPHLILYKDGEKVASFIGSENFNTLDKLKDLISQALEEN